MANRTRWVVEYRRNQRSEVAVERLSEFTARSTFADIASKLPNVPGAFVRLRCNGKVIDAAGDQTAVGAEAVLAPVLRWLNALPDHRLRELRTATDGDLFDALDAAPAEVADAAGKLNAAGQMAVTLPWIRAVATEILGVRAAEQAKAYQKEALLA